MFIMTRNPRWYLISLAVSVGIFLIMYFTVIRPDNNAANTALQQAGQQIQQATKQANQALQSSGAPAAVSPTVNAATKYASCVTAAGTDTGALQACAAKFGH